MNHRGAEGTEKVEYSLCVLGVLCGSNRQSSYQLSVGIGFPPGYWALTNRSCWMVSRSAWVSTDRNNQRPSA